MFYSSSISSSTYYKVLPTIFLFLFPGFSFAFLGQKPSQTQHTLHFDSDDNTSLDGAQTGTNVKIGKRLSPKCYNQISLHQLELRFTINI